MKPNKQYIRHYLLFCFHQKKSAADAHLFVRRTMNNVIAISANWFKCKNDDFDQ